MVIHNFMGKLSWTGVSSLAPDQFFCYSHDMYCSGLQLNWLIEPQTRSQSLLDIEDGFISFLFFMSTFLFDCTAIVNIFKLGMLGIRLIISKLTDEKI